jgi:putative ABC transport system permease protein
MIYSLQVAWRNVSARPIQTTVSALVVALAIALFVAVALLSDALQRGIIRASDPFGVLVVGAKGSAQQLVLSTLLLQGNPVGNIPQHIFDDLAADPRTALVVPIAMGDNVGGARIIGTNENFFALRPSELEEPAFQLASGRLFAADFEVVLGSRAAQGLGLREGDQFVPSHGVTPGLEQDVHGEAHTVVGILQPSRTPYDNAAFTTVVSVQSVHAEHADEEHADEEHADEEHTDEEHTDEEHADEEHADEEHTDEEHTDEEHADEEHTDEEHADEEHADEEHADDQITAILVKPTGFIEQNELWQEFYTGTEAQAAFPGRELGGLFDLLNQGQTLLVWVGYLAAGMAGLTLFLAVYGAAGARERLLAIMRGLGANRQVIFQVVMFEAMWVALLGALAGRALGYGTAWLITQRLADESAIPLRVRYLPELETLLWLLPLGLGLVAGLLPAWQAYRVNVIEKLFPT